MISADQYLAEAGERDQAFNIYQKLPDISSPKGETTLKNLSDIVGRHVGILIHTNVCDGCGRSLTAADTFCEHCGNSQDHVFDILGEIAERGGVGRITSFRGR